MSERTTPLRGTAIMGMACRFPGGIQSTGDYWNVISTGRSVIAELPPDRFLVDAVFDPDRAATGLSYSKWGGFLTDIAGFDHGFFEISPREAEAMDPQQRLLLMTAYEAMEDAGLTRRDLQQARTGVFVGVSAAEYANLQRYRRTQGDAFTGTGAALSIVANRLSHRLNLSGPSLSVDTACSSSLVALDQAILNLQNDRCDIAIVAGVHVLADFGGFVAFSKAGMLSPTGEIATFDARANGYVRGEGVGVVILKRQADAEAAGNRVLARIRATAVNQDGSTPTLTAPNAEAQRAMLEELCRRAGLDPLAIDYVEAHGTGTPVGDPIEASAIGRVFGGYGRRRPLLVGSVKPNIGHLEPAAGIAGLIKAVLVLRKRQVPPNFGFREPNPDIAFDGHNLRVPTRLTPIGRPGRSLRVVVNSFGFGGTNASVLLEAPDAARGAPATGAFRDPAAIPVSGASPAALAKVAREAAHALKAGAAPVDAVIAALRARDPKPWRQALTVDSAPDMIRGLEDIKTALGEPSKPLARPELAFAYGGQGGQWWAMGRRLLAESAAFAAAFGDFEQRFRALAGWSVRATLLADEASSRLHQSQFAMPALFGLQHGLTAYWAARGLKARFVMGHSFGEVAAAVAAGAMPLDDATRLIYVRSRIRQRLGRDSAMLVLGVRPAALAELVPDHLRIDLAAINSSTMVTVAGEQADIAALARHLTETRRDLFVRRVQSDTAWHSRLLDPLEDWFRAELGNVSCAVPEIPFISTVTGEPECRLDADYWWRNLREPVQYAAGVAQLLRLGANVLLELSPHRILTGSNALVAAELGTPVRAIASLERDKDEFFCLERAAGDLWKAGVAVAWDGPARSEAAPADLPAYSWELTPHWRLPEEARALLLAAPRHYLLGRRDDRPGFSWSNEISLAGNAMLADHTVGQSVVFPAAGYLELMLAAGREALGDGTLELEAFKILSAVVIGAADDIFIATRFDPATGRVTVHTRLRQGAPNWSLRAAARLRLTDVAPEPSPMTAAEAAIGDAQLFTAESFYPLAARLGFAYGETFRTVTDVRASSVAARARLTLPPGATNPVRPYFLHPALLDGVLQVALAFALVDPADRHRLLLPTTIDRLVCRGPLPHRLRVEAHRRQRSGDEFGVDFAVTDETGSALLAISGLGMRAVPQLAEAQAPAGPQFVIEELIERGDGLMPPAQAPAWLMTGPGLPAGSRYAGLDPTQVEERLRHARDEPRIVFVAGPPGPDFDVVAAARQNVHALIDLGKALRQFGRPARLTVVTRGARDPDGEGIGAAGLAGSAVVGLARTLAAELDNVRVRQIDLALGAPLELLESVPVESDETEWVVRGQRVWVPRLQMVPPAKLPARTVEMTTATNFALSMTAPGRLGGLRHVGCDMPRPGPGEVLIETAAAGLNFRDVMAATGLLPARAEPVPAWQTLGLEFSGTVREIGPGVGGIVSGDRVLCMGRSAMQAWSVRPADSVVAIPDDMDLALAAGIGTAFATAHYALGHIARVQRGERVLIHLGTGGVGLAAIQTARSLGAEIFATAGSEEKRRYLRDIGVDGVMNSRGLAFADALREMTGGEGVDVVLNSLSGEAQEKSLSLLRPFGRFVEIGKRDVYEDRLIGLEALARNISVHVVDLAGMRQQRPALLPQIFAAVMEGFRTGRLQPLPTSVYPAARAEDAFRHMAEARHIGKIVLAYAGQTVPVQQRADRLAVRGEAVYLITGGTGGFGAAVALRLAEAGAGKVILASRTGRLTDAARLLFAKHQALQRRIETRRLDVTNAAAVDGFFAALHQQGAALGGVIHAAATLADGRLAQLTTESIDAVLAPKLEGAWNLHVATQRHGFDPEIFCCFSSIAETVGALGQANYVAANAFLRGLARHRRALGLHGQTIGWGPLAEVGMVARNEAMRRYLESAGFKLLASRDTLAALDLVLARDIGSLDYVDADWNRVARAGGETLPPRLEALLRPEASAGRRLWTELADAPRENWPRLIQHVLAKEIGLVLKLDAGAIEPARPLAELGFDSLSSIELKNRVESQLGCPIPIGAFIGTPSIQSLTLQIVELAAERLRRGATAEMATLDATPVLPAADTGQRRNKAYWMAHAAQWPDSVSFPGRRHPILPARGPLRWGRPRAFSLRLQPAGAQAKTCRDADWIRAFGRALTKLTDQPSALIAVAHRDRFFPVTVSPRDTGESVRRQLVLGRRHADFDPDLLHPEAGAEWHGPWLAQFGFYGPGARLGMPGHDLALSLARRDGNGWELTVAYDGSTLDPPFARKLAKAMAAALPLRWDGRLRAVPLDGDASAGRRGVGQPPPLPGVSQSAPALPPAAVKLIELIDSEVASEQFRRAWTLSQAMRVTPGLDPEQLQRAVSALTRRYDSLRIRLSGPRGARAAVFQPADAYKLLVHDCRQSSARFLSEVTALAEKPLLPDMEQLFEVHLLRFAGFDVVLIKVFEAIADGWSLALICDHMIRAYLGLDTGAAPPRLAEAQLLLAGRTADGRPVSALDALAPLPLPAIGRVPPGSEPATPCALGDSGQVSVTLSKGQTGSLRRAARILRTTENGLLAAAYARALALCGEVDDILLHVVHPGRPTPELEGFVGFARQASLVAARDLRRADIGAVARSLSDQFLAAPATDDPFPRIAAGHRLADGTLAAQAVPARFGFSRLLADRTLAATLMGTLVDHQESALTAFSFKVEPLELGLFGLQGNQLQLRPLSRANGTELTLFFDRDAFTRAEVEGIADCLVHQLATLPSRREAEPDKPAPMPDDDTRIWS